MKALPLMLSVVMGLALFAASGTAAERSSRSDDLGLLRTRNIFDPNRRAERVREERPAEAPPARVQVLTLVGTLLADEGARGFLSGSGTDFQPIVSPDEVVAGMKITAITPAGMALQRDDTSIFLGVGQSLRRAGEGAWELSGDSPPAATGPTPDESKPESTVTSTPPGASEEMSDVMRRMMERRRQEESR